MHCSPLAIENKDARTARRHSFFRLKANTPGTPHAIRDQRDCDERAFKDEKSLAHSMCDFFIPFCRYAQPERQMRNRYCLTRQVWTCGQVALAGYRRFEDRRATVLPCAG
jgi:hypothetical protein